MLIKLSLKSAAWTSDIHFYDSHCFLLDDSESKRSFFFIGPESLMFCSMTYLVLDRMLYYYIVCQGGKGDKGFILF